MGPTHPERDRHGPWQRGPERRGPERRRSPERRDPERRGPERRGLLRRGWQLCLAGWLGLAGLVCGPWSQVRAETPDWVSVAARVDAILERRAEEEGLAANGRCTDEEFLRRVSLDLIGRIPEVSEVRRFLADARPDRRRREIERLLDSPRQAAHLATRWGEVLLPESSDARQAGNRVALESWLQARFAEGTPYDRMVWQLLTAEGDLREEPQISYYTALDFQPAALAAGVSRSLLGLQIQCAECHDHPFGAWTRRDFWGLAAFFARVARPAGSRPFAFGRLTEAEQGEVTLPGSQEVVAPRFPDGERPEEKGSRRQALGQWLAGPGREQLARATVNRVWAEVFGLGLVEPVDDLGPHNPPSHPEALEELSDYLIASQFDLDALLRVLTNTRAYQRSSRATSDAAETEVLPAAERLFCRKPVKSLTGPQLYDSLSTALHQGNGMNQRAMRVAPRLDPARRAFLARFDSRSAGGTEYEAGIPQALTLMNGPLMAEGTALPSSPLLRALQAPFLTPADQVEILFLATLSRCPESSERELLADRLRQTQDQAARHRVLGDILWALLNSAEFALNH